MGEGIHATKKFDDTPGAFRRVRQDVTITANNTITRKWSSDDKASAAVTLRVRLPQPLAPKTLQKFQQKWKSIASEASKEL